MGLRSWILESEKEVMPLKEVMAQEYQKLVDWLHQFDLGRDEIKETLPELYMDIQDAIEALDSAFAIEDMTAFQDALDKGRLLYTEALFKCGRRIAMKIWSEVLGCYLWVVDIDKDMHFLRSQGIQEPFYIKHEIRELRKLDKEGLREVHKVKGVFENSKIEEVKTKRSNDHADKGKAK